MALTEKEREKLDNIAKTVTETRTLMYELVMPAIHEMRGVKEKGDATREILDEIMDPKDGDLAIAYLAATDWVETKKKAKWLIGGGVAVGTAGGFSVGKTLAGLMTLFHP